ncbi:hypothetical protein CHS0354_018952 [Potamilus streckersoni]|uniref:NADH dehydrogenase [ubiquinone] 1 alpha subcomplex subunit 13 n=1 Tax=Potamilus streckersoni TaxID=2493646 RepID=A0AAE0W8W0_9BIVA|nr:hypothetical protein CHS0354_018952 [Potamilus streckersoni]
MASSGGYTQDLPPQGGYGPIDWAKRIPKRVNGFMVFGSFIAFTTAAWVIFMHRRRIEKGHDLEVNDARIAVHPLYEAERHRMLMRLHRQNRDEERELMKNVPGWELGTFYGEPVFYNMRERFYHPTLEELYAHTKWYDIYNKAFEKLEH